MDDNRSRSRRRSRDRSRRRSCSRSRVSEETDGNGRPVWRPHSYREHGDGEYSVRIGDYDRLFLCRSCHRMLSSPVYECPNGHVTCSTCRDNIGDNCCNSCKAKGCVRSLAVEEFLGRISFPCRNQQYGCKVFLLHHEMHAHERTCHYDPCFCFCPAHDCGFAGPASDLGSHLATIHRWEVINFRYGESFEAPAFDSAIFRCEDYGELFHISSSRKGLDTALSMICIRPDNACKGEFTYELKMPAGGRRHLLQIQSTVWNTSLRYGIGEGCDVFLLVPHKLPGVENGCAVEVCIRKVVAGN